MPAALIRWLTALKSDDAATRYDALDNVPWDSAPATDVIDELVRVLGDDDDLMRLGAAEALGRSRSNDALTALRRHLARETHALAKAYTLSSIGLIGNQEDISLLLKYSQSESPGCVRVHAAQGLYELVRRCTIATLFDVIEHCEDARPSAISALSEVTLKGVDPDTLAALHVALEREVVPAWRDQLAALVRSLEETEDP